MGGDTFIAVNFIYTHSTNVRLNQVSNSSANTVINQPLTCKLKIRDRSFLTTLK